MKWQISLPSFLGKFNIQNFHTLHNRYNADFLSGFCWKVLGSALPLSHLAQSSDLIVSDIQTDNNVMCHVKNK